MSLSSRLLFSSTLPITLFLILALSLPFVWAGDRAPGYHIRVYSGDHKTGAGETHRGQLGKNECVECMQHMNPTIAGHLHSFNYTTTNSEGYNIELTFYTGKHCDGTTLRPTYTKPNHDQETAPFTIRKAVSHQICFRSVPAPSPKEALKKETKKVLPGKVVKVLGEGEQVVQPVLKAVAEVAGAFGL